MCTVLCPEANPGRAQPLWQPVRLDVVAQARRGRPHGAIQVAPITLECGDGQSISPFHEDSILNKNDLVRQIEQERRRLRSYAKKFSAISSVTAQKRNRRMSRLGDPALSHRAGFMPFFRAHGV